MNNNNNSLNVITILCIHYTLPVQLVSIFLYTLSAQHVLYSTSST